jgi:hypothetical protein
MTRLIILVAWFGMVNQSSASLASGQAVIIRGEPTCRACNIDRPMILQIGESRDIPIKGPVVTPVARDSRGRFFVNDQDHGPVKVFGPDGKFVMLLGGIGSGPGESLWPATVAVGVGDSVFVTDRELKRCNVFGPDLKFVRAFPIAVSTIAVHSDVVGDLLVLNAQGRDNADVGFPIVAFDALGGLAKRIGPEEPQMDQSQTWRIERVIGRVGSRNGGLLVAHRNRYQWQQLSGSLDQEAEFIREAPWFRGFAEPMMRTPSPTWMDQVSYLKAIWDDEAGRTWVALGTIHVRLNRDGNPARTESSRIEVLDVRNRTVIASVEFAERLVSVFSDGTMVTSEVRDDGTTVLSVRRLTLRGPAAEAGNLTRER